MIKHSDFAKKLAEFQTIQIQKVRDTLLKSKCRVSFLQSSGMDYCRACNLQLAQELSDQATHVHYVDLSAAKPGYGIWEQVVDILEGEGWFSAKIEESLVGQSAQEILQLDCQNNEDILDRASVELMLDRLIEESYLLFEAIQKVLLTEKEDMHYFVLDGIDFRQYHLFNLIWEYSKRTETISQVRFVSIIDTSFSENLKYTNLLSEYQKIEAASLSILIAPKPTVDTVKKTISWFRSHERVLQEGTGLQQAAIESVVSLKKKQIFCFDTLTGTLEHRLDIRFEESHAAIQQTPDHISLLSHLDLVGLLKQLYQKDYEDLNLIERFLAGVLFYLSPNYQWADAYVEKIMGGWDPHPAVFASSLQMVYGRYQEESVRKRFHSLIDSGFKKDGQHHYNLLGNVMRTQIIFRDKETLEISESMLTMSFDFTDKYKDFLNHVMHVLHWGVRYMHQKDFQSESINGIDFVLRYFESRSLLTTRILKLLPYTSYLKLLNPTAGYIAFVHKSWRIFDALYQFDIEVQVTFTDASKHLVSLANLANSYISSGQVDKSLKYFDLAVATCRATNPDYLFTALVPRMELLVGAGVISKRILNDFNDITACKGLDGNTSTVDLDAIRDLLVFFELGEVNPRAIPSTLKKRPVKTMIEIIVSLDKMRNFGLNDLVELSQSYEDHIFNPNLAKAVAESKLEIFYLEELRREGVRSRNIVLMILYRVLIQELNKGKQDIDWIACAEQIEQKYVRDICQSWKYEAKGWVRDSILSRPLFCKNMVSTAKHSDIVWQTFLESLKGYESANSVIEYGLLLASNMYNLRSAKAFFPIPNNQNDMCCITFSRNIVNMKGFIVKTKPFQIQETVVPTKSISLGLKPSVVANGDEIEIQLPPMKLVLSLRNSKDAAFVLESIESSFMARRQLMEYALDGYLTRSHLKHSQAILETQMQKKDADSSRLISKLNEFSKTVFEKNKKISAIMDRIPLGIFTFSEDFLFESEHSASLAQLLGMDSIVGKSVLSYFIDRFEQSHVTRDIQIELLTAVIGEDYVNFEINAGHFPRTVTIGDKILGLTWSPLVDENSIVKKVLVSIEDQTDEYRLRKEAEDHDRMMAMVAKLLKITPEGLGDFINSSLEFLRKSFLLLIDEDVFTERYLAVLHDVHTIKGNARTMGLDDIANHCHQIESCIFSYIDGEGDYDFEDVIAMHQMLTDDFIYIRDINYDVLGRKEISQSLTTSESIEVLNVIESLPVGAMRSDTRKKILELLDLDLQSLGDVLNPVIEGMRSTAKTLGRPIPNIDIFEMGKTLPRYLNQILVDVFTHLFNNALDHSIEDADVRRGKGKLEAGLITVHLTVKEDELHFAIYDDGAGANLNGLAKLAHERGVVWKTEEKLLEVMFMHDASTKQEVSMISGRGLGMGAIKERIEALGGTFAVAPFDQSEPIDGRLRVIFKIVIPTSSDQHALSS